MCLLMHKKRKSQARGGGIQAQNKTNLTTKKSQYFKKFPKADPTWAPFTALKYKELGLLISAREVDLPISLRLTDSVKH